MVVKRLFDLKSQSYLLKGRWRSRKEAEIEGVKYR